MQICINEFCCCRCSSDPRSLLMPELRFFHSLLYLHLQLCTAHRPPCPRNHVNFLLISIQHPLAQQTAEARTWAFTRLHHSLQCSHRHAKLKTAFAAPPSSIEEPFFCPSWTRRPPRSSTCLQCTMSVWLTILHIAFLHYWSCQDTWIGAPMRPFSSTVCQNLNA